MAWIWRPGREWVEQTNAHRMMRRLGFDETGAFLQWSRDDLEAFWAEMMSEMNVRWMRPYRPMCAK